MNAEQINVAIEDNEQAILRKQAKEAVRAGGPAHFFSDHDTFDRIPGGMVARRNNAVRPVVALPDGDEYGVNSLPMGGKAAA